MYTTISVVALHNSSEISTAAYNMQITNTRNISRARMISQQPLRAGHDTRL